MTSEVLIKFTGDTKSVDGSIKGVTKSIVAGLGITKAVGAAFNMVRNSVGGAVERLDTINNFPKVMSNLGIGAADAQKSINTLSDKLQGLPTALNDGAAAVQRLTSKNGDIKKSTDMFLAMNNAILAGGAPMHLQTNALEQMSQAYAKGKPDMMEWRTMMSAMPAQLKQVATAMGYVDADALGIALREGDVSMNSFMDTIMRLNKEGIPGFQNFEQQARNSTGGIQTAITNMKTAVTRGVANAIDSLDKGLKSSGIEGGLSQVISTIGQVIEGVLKKVSAALTVIIPIVGKIFNWVVQHKTLVITLVTVITSMIVAFKVLSAVMAVVNAVMLANPIVLIITAVVGLIAGLVLLWKKCEGFRNFFIGIWTGIKTAVMTVWNVIKTSVLAVVNVIKNVITGIAIIIQTVVMAIWNFARPYFEFVKNMIILYIAIVTTVITAIFNVLKTVATWIWNNVLSPVVNFVSGIITTVKTYVSAGINTIKAIILTISNFIWGKVLSPVINFFRNAFNTVWGVVSGVVNKIRNAFSSVGNFIKNTFNKVKTFIKNIFSTVSGLIKAPINGVIGGINKVLGKMNGIKIPDWVPGLGGKSPHFSLIPKLATGTNYVPNDTLAMIHKGEAVVPKKFNPYANGLSPQLIGGMNAGKGTTIINNIDVTVEQDPLGQVVNKIKTYSGGAKNDYNYGMGV